MNFLGTVCVNSCMKGKFKQKVVLKKMSSSIVILKCVCVGGGEGVEWGRGVVTTKVSSLWHQFSNHSKPSMSLIFN